MTNIQYICDAPPLPRMPEKEVYDGQRWGDWCFREDNLTLVLEPLLNTGKRHWRYEIDLERITSLKGMLELIFEIRFKSWGYDEVVAHLVAAFEDLFLLVSNMYKGPFDPASFLRARLSKKAPTNERRFGVL